MIPEVNSISSQLPGVITNGVGQAVMKRGLLHLLKVERKAGVTQLWWSAEALLSIGGGCQVIGRASHGHSPLLSFAERVAIKPLPGFPLYHLRALQGFAVCEYRAKGTAFSSSVLENWKLRETRKKLENYCLKPHACIILITCPERGCLLRKCLSNTLKCDSPSSVTVTVWFPEEVWQS